MAIRKDEPEIISQHQGRYSGGIALAILGGPSGKDWIELGRKIKPDVVLGVNGVNAAVHNLNYWMCSENISYAHRHAAHDRYWSEIMEMFYRDTGAQFKLINFKSWRVLRSTENCIKIRRYGFPENGVPDSFTFREYGLGFLSGWNFIEPDTHIPQQVGTSGTQLLHLAGLLGCKEVHTIGFDLMFREHESHHFYPYPDYKPDHFRKPKNFVNFEGIKTQVVWVEGARFLNTMIPRMERDGLLWKDHSEGLFKKMGMSCADE
jgi:hypothetical protein